MPRMLRSITTFLIAFSAVLTAQGAPAGASKEKLIRQLLTLTRAHTTPDALLDLLGGRLGLPPVSAAQAESEQIDIYNRHFTEEDLRELIDFFKTGTGRHFADVAPKIAAEARKNLQASTLRYIAETKQRDLAHKTRNDFRGAGFALKAYFADHKSYPESRIDGIPSKDAWGNAVEYQVSEDGQHYRLASAGPDGKPATARELERSDDIVFTDSGFVHGDDPIAFDSGQKAAPHSKKVDLIRELWRVTEAQETTADSVIDIIGGHLGLGIAPEDTRGEVRDSPQMAEIAEETELAAYQRYFTESQLKRMIAFFKSEPGEHYVEAARKIAAETRKNLKHQ